MEKENMKSLAKTFNILDIFLHGKEEFSVTEVSQLSGLNKVTVGRIMLKLTKRGYLKQSLKRGKYSLGTIFLEFSGIIKSRLKIRDIAMPYLFELNRQVKETTMLAVWNGKQSVITESFHEISYSSSPLKVIPDEGFNMPLYCTCLGKIFLANMTKEELQKYFNEIKLERRTPNTITGKKKIIKQLQEIREARAAFDDEEYAVGIRGIATGLLNLEGNIIGAISIVAPSVRLSISEMQKKLPLIKKVALEVSRSLGYRTS